jgi:hypothetical protein
VHERRRTRLAHLLPACVRALETPHLTFDRLPVDPDLSASARPHDMVRSLQAGRMNSGTSYARSLTFLGLMRLYSFNTSSFVQLSPRPTAAFFVALPGDGVGLLLFMGEFAVRGEAGRFLSLCLGEGEALSMLTKWLRVSGGCEVDS